MDVASFKFEYPLRLPTRGYHFSKKDYFSPYFIWVFGFEEQVCLSAALATLRSESDQSVNEAISAKQDTQLSQK
ncbi:hypothetical protein CYL77_00285 [Corynebacterium glutamicum]|nr:hypothetical protein CYL77_00285 [Corynebacterium glutamicum]NII98248.1 hypothetical protein [Corynebacterium glutamicum]